MATVTGQFSTPADAERCRIATARATQRYVTALVSIIALHRSDRSAEKKWCTQCHQQWPCKTVMLAVTAHQQVVT